MSAHALDPEPSPGSLRAREPAVLEPVFVPIEPPPRRIGRTRSDASLRAIEASYSPTLDLDEWVAAVCTELDGLGLGTWGSGPVQDGLEVGGSRLVVPAAGVFLQVNERADASREAVRELHIAACTPRTRLVDVQSHWPPLLEELALSPERIGAL